MPQSIITRSFGQRLAKMPVMPHSALCETFLVASSAQAMVIWQIAWASNEDVHLAAHVGLSGQVESILEPSGEGDRVVGGGRSGSEKMAIRRTRM